MMEMYDKIKEKVRVIGKSIGVLFLYLLLNMILGAIFGDLLTSTNEIISSISYILIYILMLLIISLCFSKTLIEHILTFKKENIKIAIKNWAIGFGCMIISNLYLTYFIGNIASNEASNRTLLMSNPIVSFLIMVIIAPLIEEIVFRLNLKKIVKNKYVFCIISALLFGGMHLFGAVSLKELLYIIPYGSLGFFFAKAYYETDNIYTSVIAHMFHNGLSVLVILLGTGIL